MICMNEIRETARKIIMALKDKSINEIIEIMKIVAKEMGWSIRHEKGSIPFGPVWNYIVVKIGYTVEGCIK